MIIGEPRIMKAPVARTKPLALEPLLICELPNQLATKNSATTAKTAETCSSAGPTQGRQMGGEGLELSGSDGGNTRKRQNGRALLARFDGQDADDCRNDSIDGAIPADLVEVVAAWPSLPADVRAEIVRLATEAPP